MKTLGSLFLGCAVVAGGWYGVASLYGQSFVAAKREAYVHYPFDSSHINSQILVSERAVDIDPGAAMGWTLLSSDYLARSRESDDLATAVKAEAAARKSLTIRILGNVNGRNRLIESLLQQHRFKDAIAECELAGKVRVYDDQTVRLRTESMMEVGRYREAQAAISANPRAFQGATGESIVARLLDLQGKPTDALRLMQRAAEEVDAAPAMPSNAISWFHSRLGMQLAKMGRHTEARQQFTRALQLYPRDYKGMVGLAKLSFQDGHWQEAIDWGTRSDAIAQMADVRALVGDAYAKLRQTDKAEAQYNRVAELVGRPSGINDGLHEAAPAPGTHGHRLDRQYALYCADHGRDPDGAYAAAIRDFEARQDIYAYDTLAWVCLRAGKKDEAVKGIRMALSQGTQDPMLFYHAGTIFAAAGNRAEAAKYLRRALAIDPHFDGLAAPRVQRLLATDFADKKETFL